MKKITLFLSFLLYNNLLIAQIEKKMEHTSKPNDYQSKNNYKIISFSDLKTKYPEEYFNDSFLWPNYDIQLFESDLTIDSDFILNENKFQNILVMGNLNVNGSIINSETDMGTNLVVKGETYAQNLVSGGSFISLQKAIIEEIVIVHSYGELEIKNLTAKVRLEDDSHISIYHNKNSIDIQIGQFEYLCTEKLLENEWFYYEQEDPKDYPHFEAEMFISELIKGKIDFNKLFKNLMEIESE